MADTIVEKRLKDKSIVFVAGMPRSGASMIARLLNLVGCEMPKSLPNATPDNAEEEVEESSVIADFNNEILESLGSSWNDWRPLDSNWHESSTVDGFKERAQETLLDQFGDGGLCVLQDVRISRLFPFWLEVVKLAGAEPFVVTSIRNPLDVAASLKAYDGVDPSIGHLIWLRYMLDCESNTRGIKRAYVSYEDAASDPLSIVHSIGETLGMVWPRRSSVFSELEMDEFVSAGMQHHKPSDDELLLNKELPHWTRSAFEIFSGWAQGEIRKEDAAKLGRIRSSFDEASVVFGPVINVSAHEMGERDNRIAELESATLARDGRVSELEAVVSKRDGRLSELESAVSERDGRLSELESAVSERNDRLSELESAVSERDGRLSELESAVSERNDRLSELESAVSERDGRLSELESVASERDDRMSELESAVSERDGRLSELRSVLSERDGRVSELESAVSERDGRLSELESAVSERNTRLLELESTASHERATLEETIRQQNEEVTDLKERLEATQSYIRQLASSTSWRLTLPLREIKRWLTTPRAQVNKYLAALARLGGRTHESPPVAHQEEISHEIGNHQVSGELQEPQEQSETSEHSAPPPASEVDPGAINIPFENNPMVSVIIPVHGKLEYTLRCLQSISTHSPSVPYEVIVVDDHSPDDSVKILKSIQGIRLLANTENEGFIRTCNRGAKEAKGEYLCFLNNDTEVTAGWLDELVRTFHEIPGTGLVGSKLVYPDGRLQEAGGIIWNDGSAWNFGRDQDPRLPEYNYAREVDYCSGASVMMVKALFESLGGFDEHYVPAYCEDSDLALKVRSLGYSVIYQPHSVVAHHEGVTSGTDVTQGIKAHQVANAKKLYDRWQATLAGHQAPGEHLDAAKDRGMKHRMLILDACTPTPDQDAGSVTAINMMYLLRSMGFQVTFIPEDNFLYMPDYTVALQRAGIEVLYHPYCNSVEQHLREHGARYDAAFLFRIDVAEKHLPSIRKHASQARAVFLPTDLHYVRLQREAELEGGERKLKAVQLIKQEELQAVRAMDATIVHSSFERDELLREVPQAKAYMSPLILNVPDRPVEVFGARRDVVFVGGYQHPPNVDAVEYFVRDIMPIMRKRLPGVRFLIVGSKMPKSIQRLAAEDIIVTGFVADLPSFLNRVRVMVCPLRYGAGAKGKVGTAMSLGLPVVSTSMGTEGMDIVPGKDVRLADEPEAFVDHIVDLYQNESSWNQVSAAGLKFARDKWGAEASWETLKDILEEFGFSGIEENRHPLKLWTGQN